MGNYKWVVSGGTIRITHVRGLLTPLRTTHARASTALSNYRALRWGVG